MAVLYRCDRCKQDTSSRAVMAKLDLYMDDAGQHNEPYWSYDICSNCVKKFNTFMATCDAPTTIRP